MALSIKLDPDIERRLSDLAQRTGRTKTYYIQEAVTSRLDDLEDIYLAETRIEDRRASKSPTIPFNEVIDEFGLED